MSGIPIYVQYSNYALKTTSLVVVSMNSIIYIYTFFNNCRTRSLNIYFPIKNILQVVTQKSVNIGAKL